MDHRNDYSYSMGPVTVADERQELMQPGLAITDERRNYALNDWLSKVMQHKPIHLFIGSPAFH